MVTSADNAAATCLGIDSGPLSGVISSAGVVAVRPTTSECPDESEAMLGEGKFLYINKF